MTEIIFRHRNNADDMMLISEDAKGLDKMEDGKVKTIETQILPINFLHNFPLI